MKPHKRWRRRARLALLKRWERREYRYSLNGGAKGLATFADTVRRGLRFSARLEYELDGYLPPLDLTEEERDLEEQQMIEHALSKWEEEVMSQFTATEEPMGQRPKLHQQRGAHGGWRCDNNMWKHHVLPLINEAQERLGSIKLVSTRIGMNEGWASSVKDHHLNIITEQSVKKLERLVNDLRNEATVKASREADLIGVEADGAMLGIKPERPDVVVTPSAVADKIRRGKLMLEKAEKEAEKEKPPTWLERVPAGAQRQKEFFKELVDALTLCGLSKPQVAQAFGYASYSGVYMVLRQGESITLWRLQRAAGIVSAFDRGDREEAHRLMLQPNPLKVEPVEPPTPQQELSGDVRRIGPERRPKYVPSRDPIPQPRVPVEPPAQEPLPGLKLTAESAERLDQIIANGKTPPQVTAAPAPPKEPEPVTRESRIARLRDRLTEIAVDGFDDMKMNEPKFLHAAWDAKRDELVKFIESLE